MKGSLKSSFQIKSRTIVRIGLAIFSKKLNGNFLIQNEEGVGNGHRRDGRKRQDHQLDFKDSHTMPHFSKVQVA